MWSVDLTSLGHKPTAVIFSSNWWYLSSLWTFNSSMVSNSASQTEHPIGGWKKSMALRWRVESNQSTARVSFHGNSLQNGIKMNERDSWQLWVSLTMTICWIMSYPDWILDHPKDESLSVAGYRYSSLAMSLNPCPTTQCRCWTMTHRLLRMTHRYRFHRYRFPQSHCCYRIENIHRQLFLLLHKCQLFQHFSRRLPYRTRDCLQFMYFNFQFLLLILILFFRFKNVIRWLQNSNESGVVDFQMKIGRYAKLIERDANEFVTVQI